MKKLYINPRRLRIILGIIWIIDAFFELQPKLFGTFLASQIISGAAVNQPKFIHSQIEFAVRLLLKHTFIYNSLFFLIELSIGILILNKKTLRLGLKLSMFWALMVWYFGEGLGNLLTHNALLLTGAPGAALLYFFIAVGIYPYKNKKTKYLENCFSIIVVAYYLTGIILILSSSMNPAIMASQAILHNASISSGILRLIQLKSAHFILSWGNYLIYFSIGIYLLLCSAVFAKEKIRNVAIIFGIILALAFWVIGQNLGNILIGGATDLNSGPLVILMLLGLSISPRFKLKLAEI